MSSYNAPWTRREWMATVANTSALAVAAPMLRTRDPHAPPQSCGIPMTSRLADPAQMAALVRKGVEAAQRFGARYADARLTRVVYHHYSILGGPYAASMSPKGGGSHGSLGIDTEAVGLGIRALVNGAWGFAAAPVWIGAAASDDDVAAIAKDAVRQAKATAGGSAVPIELAPTPVVTGHWTTPITIDPFAIPIEEKIATIGYWKAQATNTGVQVAMNGGKYLEFSREERALATSDGTLVTQVLYESGGVLTLESLNARMKRRNGRFDVPAGIALDRIVRSGKGWELFDDARIPEQFERIHEALPAREEVKNRSRAGDVGRYTIVCDGNTMASMLEHTLGSATQLDRAMAYEANASGTSFITNPLDAVGTLRLAPDSVTVTANRTAPGQLATVQWDDEGVVPEPFTLVKNGLLDDFQTTREQATWLASYYQRTGRPVRSHGCSAAEDALFISMEHMPNLSLEPAVNGPDVDGLVASVTKGILLEHCHVTQVDSQGRWGLVAGEWGDRASRVREISNGRVGPQLNGLGMIFDAVEFWKHVTAVGGPATQTTTGSTGRDYGWALYGIGQDDLAKGMPKQMCSHSVQAVAAIIENQTLIDPSRKA